MNIKKVFPVKISSCLFLRIPYDQLMHGLRRDFADVAGLRRDLQYIEYVSAAHAMYLTTNGELLVYRHEN